MYIYMEIHLKESYFAGNCTIFHRLFFLSHLSLRTYKSNKKNIHENPELKGAYRQWCSDEGSSEKNGFFDFAEEYLSNQNEVWASLTDYDDE